MRPYWHNLFRRLQEDQAAGPPPGPVLCAGAAMITGQTIIVDGGLTL